MGVSLWLCPRKNQPLNDKLSTLMGSLNLLFPGLAPRFEPHVTITSNISVNLDDPTQTREDVNRILSAGAVAANSLPNTSDIVTLGRINSQRKYFKKLYFEVRRDPNLLSLAQIIREIFVITPQEIELANQKINPHLYSKDSHGTLRRKLIKKHRKSRSRLSSSTTGTGTGTNTGGAREDTTVVNPVDMTEIQRIAALKAAQWASEEFDPHLSLVYSDIYSIDNALWRTIKTRVLDFLNIENCDADDLVDNGLGWNGGVLKLVLCEGDVNDWIELGSVDLH